MRTFRIHGADECLYDDGQSRCPRSPAVIMHRRILVVDDYEPAATAITRLLRLCGHAVVTASAGREVVPLALEFRPDVIFLDLSLGTGEGGLAIASRLREHE